MSNDGKKNGEDLSVFLEGQKARTEKVLKRLIDKAKESQEKLEGLNMKIKELEEAISGFEKAILRIQAKSSLTKKEEK